MALVIPERKNEGFFIPVPKYKIIAFYIRIYGLIL